jgi:RNA-directed DNA polymerase
VSLATPEKIRQLQRKLYVKAKQEPAFRFYQLYDKVYREDILAHAYAVARSAKGARTAGVDGVTFEQIEEQGLEKWLAERREELRTKTYGPSPVRRVMIPKPGGGERPLGIPTVRDRVIQTAAKLVLEPIFEADMADSAYGYRPGRSAQQAVAEVHEALCSGYTDVVDADLSKYFDTIPHDQLMQSVARRVVDREMLKLIKGWLKAPVEERDDKGNRRMSGGKGSRTGTPQGGVISPLLANIYMNRFLRVWRDRGKGKDFRARLIAYADDFVILSRGKAVEALAFARWAMTSMGLTLNEAKTRLCDGRREDFRFLGYEFGPDVHHATGRRYLAARPAKKSIQRVKEKVRALLTPGNQDPWEAVAGSLNRTLRGWSNYFRLGTRWPAYRAIEHYVEERARHFLRRRHKAARGCRRFSRERLHGPLGVVSMRTLYEAQPASVLA